MLPHDHLGDDPEGHRRIFMCGAVASGWRSTQGDQRYPRCEALEAGQSRQRRTLVLRDAGLIVRISLDGAELRHTIGPRGRGFRALRALGVADIPHIRIPAGDVSIELGLARVAAGLFGGRLELFHAAAERPAVDLMITLRDGAVVEARADALARRGAAGDKEERSAQRKNQT